jgi:hypothetical protein
MPDWAIVNGMAHSEQGRACTVEAGACRHGAQPRDQHAVSLHLHGWPWPSCPASRWEAIRPVAPRTGQCSGCTRYVWDIPEGIYLCGGFSGLVRRFRACVAVRSAHSHSEVADCDDNDACHHPIPYPSVWGLKMSKLGLRPGQWPSKSSGGRGNIYWPRRSLPRPCGAERRVDTNATEELKETSKSTTLQVNGEWIAQATKMQVQDPRRC